jgi:hypothetical protein
MFVSSLALSDVGPTLELSCKAPVLRGFVSFNSLFDSAVILLGRAPEQKMRP